VNGIMSSPEWRRGSKCSAGTCVEVAKVNDQYLIRDSKNPEMAAHSFTEAEWLAFVAGVKADEFVF
jgi:predicted secreted Zn-dependent protease